MKNKNYFHLKFFNSLLINSCVKKEIQIQTEEFLENNYNKKHFRIYGKQIKGLRVKMIAFNTLTKRMKNKYRGRGVRGTKY